MRKVPKLRFKEFSDEWEERKLEEYYPFIRNGFVGVATPYYCENGIKYLQSNNIHDGKINEKILKYITREFHEKNKKNELKEDDILMVQSGHAGECAVVGKKYAGSNCHALIILSSNKKSNSYFTSFYLNSVKGQKSLFSLLTGNTITHILASDIKKHKLFFPSFQEQEKIANFLSSIDEKISLTEEKLELFREYKKGAMQKIFSQELRFKDSEGNDYPEWEERKLGEISEVKDGTHDSPKYVSNGFPLVTSKNVKNGKIDLNEVNYISKEDFDIINKRSKVSKGDILMGMIGTIGNLAIVDREDFAIKNVALIKEKSDLKNNFLIYLLQSCVFYKKIALLNEGGTQKFISLGNIRNLLFFIPTLEEQQKIADFLSSIDSKIESIEKKLEGLKEFKRGLLQQMFV